MFGAGLFYYLVLVVEVAVQCGLLLLRGILFLARVLWYCFRVLHLIPAFLWLVFCFAAEMFQWKILSVLEFKLFGMWELDYIVFWAVVIGAAVYLLIEIVRWCCDTCEPVTSFIRNHMKSFAELFKTKKREEKTHILKR